MHQVNVVVVERLKIQMNMDIILFQNLEKNIFFDVQIFVKQKG